MERASATDAELIDASRRGERDAFAELIERCTRIVRAVSYAATRDHALSEDVAQDTFLAAWRDLDRLRDPAALRPWLCRIARNLAHKARRRRVREVPTVVSDAVVAVATPFDGSVDRELDCVVVLALERVPERHREVLVMFYYEQQSARDVAVALGIAEAAVHKRLSRARKHLAAGIEELVDAELSRGRSRRDLAVCVLAALPVAGTPSPARAATKGSSMWKLGALGMATAAVAVSSVSAWSRPHSPRDERTTHSARTSVGAGVKHSPKPPQLPGPAAVTCAAAVRHGVEISLKGFEAIAANHPANVQRATAILEEQCLGDGWSPNQPASSATITHGTRRTGSSRSAARSAYGTRTARSWPVG